MRWFETEDRGSKILKRLASRQTCSEEALVETLNVGAKTIKNEVKLLNDQLKDGGVITFENGHYKLYITNSERFETVKNRLEEQRNHFESPQLRMIFIVDSLMNSDTPLLLDELAYGMNIGRTTLVGDIKKLKTILRPYGLDIYGKTNTGVELTGDELSLRTFILENAYDIIYGSDTQEPEISEMVTEVLAPYYLDSMTLKYFLRYLTITLDRFGKGYTLTFKEEKYKKLADDPCHTLVLSILRKLKKEKDILLPASEQLFLTIPLAGMRMPTVVEGIESLIVISDETISLVQEILTTLQQQMGLTVKLTEMLDEFIYHIHFMSNRLRYGFKLYNPMTKDIKEKYGVAYKMAQLAAEIIQKRLGETLSPDETGFLAAYFEVFISEQRMEHKKNYNVAVICGSGRATARLVLNQLQGIFDSSATLKIFQDSQIDPGEISTYDLVITTVALDQELPTPVIHLEEIFDEQVVKKRIDSVRYIKKLNIPLVSGMESILLSILDESTFFILDNDKTYEENVQMMIGELTLKGYLDSGFQDRINEREKKSSMVFDDTVAFPHGYQEIDERVTVAVGVLGDKGCPGLYPGLKIIFLLALPRGNEDDTVLVKVYDELIAIAGDKATLSTVSMARNYHEFLMHFIKDSELFK